MSRWRSQTFLIAPNDKDSHNPFLISTTPADMTRQERQAYIRGELKKARRERRKEIQKAKSRLSHRTMEDTMVTTLHHGHHGDQETDECILLTEEDNTKRYSVQFFS